MLFVSCIDKDLFINDTKANEDKHSKCRVNFIDTRNLLKLSAKKGLFDQNFQPTAPSSGLMPILPGPGAEFADFGDRDLLFGLTSEEAWINLSEEDLKVRLFYIVLILQSSEKKYKMCFNCFFHFCCIFYFLFFI